MCYEEKSLYRSCYGTGLRSPVHHCSTFLDHQITRKRKVLESKCYLIVFGCPIPRLMNLQTIETKDTESIISGLICLSCEVGTPKHFLVDKDSAILKALQEAEIPIKDVQRDLRSRIKVEFTTCPVSGHNFHGFLERKIRSLCRRRTHLDHGISQVHTSMIA